MLWSSQELTEVLQISTSLLYLRKARDQPVLQPQRPFAWDLLEVTLSRFTLELWQKETVVETSYEFDEVLAVHLSLVEMRATPK
ncbi:hypothetical protein ACKI1Q_43780, partial [Streptomyces galilaeus]|uniref:hypothetical protein n=1 Tax=Streptomyces galilaeus TaxID=33899 RepID=UPI0038F7435B